MERFAAGRAVASSGPRVTTWVWPTKTTATPSPSSTRAIGGSTCSTAVSSACPAASGRVRWPTALRVRPSEGEDRPLVHPHDRGDVGLGGAGGAKEDDDGAEQDRQRSEQSSAHLRHRRSLLVLLRSVTVVSDESTVPRSCTSALWPSAVLACRGSSPDLKTLTVDEVAARVRRQRRKNVRIRRELEGRLRRGTRPQREVGKIQQRYLGRLADGQGGHAHLLLRERALTRLPYRRGRGGEARVHERASLVPAGSFGYRGSIARVSRWRGSVGGTASSRSRRDPSPAWRVPDSDPTLSQGSAMSTPPTVDGLPFLQLVRWIRGPFPMLEDCMARHGDAFTLRLPIGPEVTIVVRSRGGQRRLRPGAGRGPRREGELHPQAVPRQALAPLARRRRAHEAAEDDAPRVSRGANARLRPHDAGGWLTTPSMLSPSGRSSPFTVRCRGSRSRSSSARCSASPGPATASSPAPSRGRSTSAPRRFSSFPSCRRTTGVSARGRYQRGTPGGRERDPTGRDPEPPGRRTHGRREVRRRPGDDPRGARRRGRAAHRRRGSRRAGDAPRRRPRDHGDVARLGPPLGLARSRPSPGGCGPRSRPRGATRSARSLASISWTLR